MTTTIVRTIRFRGATPETLFDIYTDPAKHGRLIGSRVRVSSKSGASFSAFDGAVEGKNLVVVPGRLIVQSWRGGVWNRTDPDSILVLAFEKTGAGAQIRMVHGNLPGHFEERWDELYWRPLAKMLATVGGPGA